jgi:hypothetical protein
MTILLGGGTLFELFTNLGPRIAGAGHLTEQLPQDRRPEWAHCINIALAPKVCDSITASAPGMAQVKARARDIVKASSFREEDHPAKRDHSSRRGGINAIPCRHFRGGG